MSRSNFRSVCRRSSNASMTWHAAVWIFCFEQKTAYGMRISDWSSDVCSSDLVRGFITGTDKKAGLYVFGLDRRKLQFLPDGLLNNVDLRIATVGGREQVILGASDRGRMGIAL